jgi:hypothetical protein
VRAWPEWQHSCGGRAAWVAGGAAAKEHAYAEMCLLSFARAGASWLDINCGCPIHGAWLSGSGCLCRWLVSHPVRHTTATFRGDQAWPGCCAAAQAHQAGKDGCWHCSSSRPANHSED